MQQKHAETMHEAPGSESPRSFEQAMPCPKSYVVRTIQNHKPLSGSYNLQTKTSLCCDLTQFPHLADQSETPAAAAA